MYGAHVVRGELDLHLRTCLVCSLFPTPLLSPIFLPFNDGQVFLYYFVTSPKTYCLELKSLCSDALRWCFQAGACVLAPGFLQSVSIILQQCSHISQLEIYCAGCYTCKQIREERNPGMVSSNKILNESMSGSILTKIWNNRAQTIS